MKLFKKQNTSYNIKNSNRWELISSVVKLAKENNIIISLNNTDNEDEATKSNEVSFELDISPNANIYEEDKGFNPNDFVNYIVKFNFLRNNDYSIKLNYVYQMEEDVNINSIPKEIKSIKELEQLFKTIKTCYDEKYL